MPRKSCKTDAFSSALKTPIRMCAEESFNKNIHRVGTTIPT